MIALGIPHCGWDPKRVESLRRLQGELAKLDGPVAGIIKIFSEPGPTKAHIWSRKMWEWAVSTGADHFLTIQDDALVAPHFWTHLTALLEAVPNNVIGLQAIHPLGPQLWAVGCNWYTTTDMIPGVSYVLPIGILRRFLAWQDHELRPGARETLNEDTLLGLFCAAEGHRIWHPVPTIVDHDSSLPSNYANERTGNRNPTCLWTKHHYPDTWTPRNPLPQPNGQVPHLGRFYQQTPAQFARWVKPYDKWEETVNRIENDLVKVYEMPPQGSA